MRPLEPGETPPAPLVLHREKVRREWLDYNEHMNVAYYGLVFDHASDALADYIGIGWDHTRATGGSIFIVEAHLAYFREVVEDDPLRFATQVLDFDEKRIHYAHAMFHDHDGYHAATNELMLLHVDLAVRRAVPMPAAVLDRLARIKQAHAALPPPTGLSRAIGMNPGASENRPT
jgi:acyl-CoA thioester hydrolase